MENIYHITTQSAWQLALQNGYYEAESLILEGFIHCSTGSQVQGVLERYFKGKTDLVRLTINPQKLTHKLIFELSPTLNQEFPHVYGRINLDAIEKVEENIS